MRSARRTSPFLSLGLACAVVIALLAFACAHAAPPAAGALGGAWKTIDAPFWRLPSIRWLRAFWSMI